MLAFSIRFDIGHDVIAELWPQFAIEEQEPEFEVQFGDVLGRCARQFGLDAVDTAEGNLHSAERGPTGIAGVETMDRGQTVQIAIELLGLKPCVPRFPECGPQPRSMCVWRDKGLGRRCPLAG